MLNEDKDDGRVGRMREDNWEDGPEPGMNIPPMGSVIGISDGWKTSKSIGNG